MTAGVPFRIVCIGTFVPRGPQSTVLWSVPGLQASSTDESEQERRRGRAFCINDGIEPELCSLSYASVDSAVAVIMRLGRATVLEKLDLESVYRIIPVHPDDRPLFGMEWEGSWFIDTALTFGLRSAPKIFTAMADGLLWIMAANGVTSALHYLDDYLIFGSPGTTVCGDALTLALSLCQQLGVPASQKKLEGTATTLVFLGVVLDTEALELRLPGEKLSRLRSTIADRKSCTKRDLLSLIGHLQSGSLRTYLFTSNDQPLYWS